MRTLVLEVQQGNLDSLIRLAEALKDRVRCIAARYARTTAEEFDDLLQEAWLGILEALPEVDVGIGDPAEYLLKRARWRVLDYVKWQRRRQCDRLDDLRTRHAPDAPASDAISSAAVSGLLMKLSTTQRRLLNLLLDGHTWREAADKLDCVSSNVAYHVKAIRKAYVELMDEPRNGGLCGPGR